MVVKYAFVLSLVINSPLVIEGIVCPAQKEKQLLADVGKMQAKGPMGGLCIPMKDGKVPKIPSSSPHTYLPLSCEFTPYPECKLKFPHGCFRLTKKDK